MDIANIDAQLAHLVQARSGFYEQDLGVLHGLIGLHRRILRSPSQTEHAAAVQLSAGLSAQIDLIIRANDHAGVAVNGRLVKPVARIEYAQALVRPH